LKEEISQYPVDTIAYYERPWLKQLRRWYSGEGIQWDQLTTRQIMRSQLGAWSDALPCKTYGHHLCHAAAGFQTSAFDRATVVVIDAIGEWDTITIWAAEYRHGRAQYRRLWSQQYPHSIGLFYSAVTDSLGLNPMDEEYITMGMAAYGRPTGTSIMKRWLVDNEYKVTFKHNLHVGLPVRELPKTWLSPPFAPSMLDKPDVAASAQALAEHLIYNVMHRAAAFGWSKNLVYGGGVALNCVANSALGDYFDRVWIMPCPGDAGSSIGSAALAMGGPVDWRGPYLGSNIPGAYPTNQLLDHLVSHRVVGVASGRAEFGPRALGNRSLLADPRGADIRDLVNEIKQRQQFRPFAPAILAEVADQYFDMPRGWSDHAYMQTVARCKQPELYPAIVHKDGTSRVQTVSRDSGSDLRELLEKWYVWTGC
jgi:carbamoyltransferase